MSDSRPLDGMSRSEQRHYRGLCDSVESIGYNADTAKLPLSLLARQMDRADRMNRELDQMGLMVQMPDGTKAINPIAEELRLLETAILRGMSSMFMTPRSRMIAKLVESIQSTVHGSSLVLRVLGLKGRN